MNPLEDPSLPIVALKGPPITIAAILYKYAQPVTQTHLCDVLDYSDKTMSKALHRLKEFQILSHSAEGWSFTIHVTCSVSACLKRFKRRLSLASLWKNLWTPVLWTPIHRKRVGNFPTQARLVVLVVLHLLV